MLDFTFFATLADLELVGEDVGDAVVGLFVGANVVGLFVGDAVVGLFVGANVVGLFVGAGVGHCKFESTTFQHSALSSARLQMAPAPDKLEAE